MPTNIRPLHYVFKIAQRKKTINFYRNILNMKILRHEELSRGCQITCNGPYDGKWSRTMVGYGIEDEHFVIELTYNYGINSYEMGNEYGYLKILSNSAVDNIISKQYPFKLTEDGFYEIHDPNGYKFLVGKSDLSSDDNLIPELLLFVTDIEVSKKYWIETLNAKLVKEQSSKIELNFDSIKFSLILEKISNEIKLDRAKAYGRIAFSCPNNDLKPLEALIKKNNCNILFPYVEFGIVFIIIFLDPDGHEICFVGDEGFRTTSNLDPNADKILDNAIFNDKTENLKQD